MRKTTLEKLLESNGSEYAHIQNNRKIEAELVRNSDSEYDEDDDYPETFLVTDIAYDSIDNICDEWEITFFYSEVLRAVLIPYDTSDDPARRPIYGID